jgi:gas vesicle protein
MEDVVNDQSRVLMSALVGAAIGALAGYLMMTDSGRRFRQHFEPALDDFVRELQRLGVTVGRARAVASEGWHALNQVAGDTGSAGYRQQAPF